MEYIQTDELYVKLYLKKGMTITISMLLFCCYTFGRASNLLNLYTLYTWHVFFLFKARFLI